MARALMLNSSCGVWGNLRLHSEFPLGMPFSAPFPSLLALSWPPHLTHAHLSRKCCQLPLMLSLTLHLSWFPASFLCPALPVFPVPWAGPNTSWCYVGVTRVGVSVCYGFVKGNSSSKC